MKCIECDYSNNPIGETKCLMCGKEIDVINIIGQSVFGCTHKDSGNWYGYGKILGKNLVVVFPLPNTNCDISTLFIEDLQKEGEFINDSSFDMKQAKDIINDL